MLSEQVACGWARDPSELKLIKSCSEIGRIVGVMHKNGIMHGDLTTSNFIVSNGKMFVLDFGLANKTKKPEDHAVDLRLFKLLHSKLMMHIDNVTNPL